MQRVVLLCCVLLNWSICAVLVSCATSPVGAPVVAHTQSLHAKIKTARYQVRAEDTLYSVAWAQSMDYHDLARLNDLHYPYRLHRGQWLLLSKSPPNHWRRSSVEWRQKRQSGRQGQSSLAIKPYTVGKSLSATVRHRQHRTDVRVLNQNLRWQKPVHNSRMVRPLLWQGKRLQGVDFIAKRGQAVHAAMPGEVVYAGFGVRGYGGLVIVKTGRSYLSAYGYNRALSVHLHQMVRQGQVIAQVGQPVGTHWPKAHGLLHFEVRKGGRSLDPRQLFGRPLRWT